MSLVEAIANVAVGFGVAVLAQIAVFPLFGLHVGFADNLMIAAIFTAISIARSYALRRVFEAIRVRCSETNAAGRSARRRRRWGGLLSAQEALPDRLRNRDALRDGAADAQGAGAADEVEAHALSGLAARPGEHGVLARSPWDQGFAPGGQGGHKAVVDGGGHGRLPPHAAYSLRRW
jgi:hypothetical protein